jgi:hypothetical protein
VSASDSCKRKTHLHTRTGEDNDSDWLSSILSVQTTACIPLTLAVSFTQERVEESERTLVKREGVAASSESELVVVRPSEWCGVEWEMQVSE